MISPTLLGSFQVKQKLSNFRLSNFSCFPTALSNYTYPCQTFTWQNTSSQIPYRPSFQHLLWNDQKHQFANLRGVVKHSRNGRESIAIRDPYSQSYRDSLQLLHRAYTIQHLKSGIGHFELGQSNVHVLRQMIHATISKRKRFQLD